MGAGRRLRGIHEVGGGVSGVEGTERGEWGLGLEVVEVVWELGLTEGQVVARTVMEGHWRTVLFGLVVLLVVKTTQDIPRRISQLRKFVSKEPAEFGAQ